jgi:hypothetical protein
MPADAFERMGDDGATADLAVLLGGAARRAARAAPAPGRDDDQRDPRLCGGRSAARSGSGDAHSVVDPAGGERARIYAGAPPDHKSGVAAAFLGIITGMWTGRESHCPVSVHRVDMLTT